MLSVAAFCSSRHRRLYKAIEDFNELLNAIRKNVFRLYLPRRSWKEKGECQKAIADFRRSVAPDPKDIEALSEPRCPLIAVGEYDKAREDFDAVKRLAAKNIAIPPVESPPRRPAIRGLQLLSPIFRPPCRRHSLLRWSDRCWARRGRVTAAPQKCSWFPTNFKHASGAGTRRLQKLCRQNSARVSAPASPWSSARTARASRTRRRHQVGAGEQAPRRSRRRWQRRSLQRLVEPPPVELGQPRSPSTTSGGIAWRFDPP